MCPPPVCGNSFAAKGTIITGVNNGKQAVLLGVSADGSSLLYEQSTTANNCDDSNLVIADKMNGKYSLQSIRALSALAIFDNTGEQSLTLSSDGLTLLGRAMDQHTLYASTRSSTGKIDFGPATAIPFATLNAEMPANTHLHFPLLSPDGLGFTFTVYGAADPSKNGFYEASRAKVSDPFSSAKLLPGVIQSYIDGVGGSGISGMSTDRLTAFFALSSFSTTILVRSSVSQPFVEATPQWAPGGWRMVPLADCSALIGTCEPGGCGNESICLFQKM
jgi:hypothetical protein